MDRATKIFKHDPLTIVEALLSIFSIIGGIFIIAVPLSDLGVAFEGTPTGAVSVITSIVGIFAVAVIAFGYSIANLWGIYKRNLKVRSKALFAQIMVRLYAFLATFLVQGLFPVTWIASLTLLFIAVVCYMVVRRKLLFLRSLGV